MSTQQIKEIAAAILFLDSPEEINMDANLNEIGFNSIDFIDFCYEIKSQINAKIEPHDIWPFDQFKLNPLLFNQGQWSPAGKNYIMEILKLDKCESINSETLEKYWTLNFLDQQIREFKDV